MLQNLIKENDGVEGSSIYMYGRMGEGLNCFSSFIPFILALYILL